MAKPWEKKGFSDWTDHMYTKDHMSASSWHNITYSSKALVSSYPFIARTQLIIKHAKNNEAN